MAFEHEQGKTYAEIAKEYDVHPSAVFYWVQKVKEWRYIKEYSDDDSYHDYYKARQERELRDAKG